MMTRVPRVAIVYHYFPHYRRGVIEALLKSDLDVHFVADETSRAIDGSIDTCVPSRNFHRVRVARPRGIGLYWLVGLWGALRRIDPEIIVFLGDMNFANAWVAGVALRLLRKRVVFWAHGWIDENESLRKAAIRSVFFRIPDQIWVYGRRARLIAVRRGFAASSIHVIYNSLDYGMQRGIRGGIANKETRNELYAHAPGLRKCANLVLCCARLTRTKRFDLAVEAVGRLQATERPGMLFVGAGPERQRLAEKCESLGVAAWFAGECYDETQLARYFSASDVLVSPGNVGLSAMHAMAYGLPVITHGNRDHQMPEVEAVIPGLTGAFFREDDVVSLAESLQTFLRSDEKARAMMSRLCVAMIETFFNPESQVWKMRKALSGRGEVERVSDSIGIHELHVG